jgi:hypothetical protein
MVRYVLLRPLRLELDVIQNKSDLWESRGTFTLAADIFLGWRAVLAELFTSVWQQFLGNTLTRALRASLKICQVLDKPFKWPVHL